MLNPKGGSGKTTIATNLASYFAQIGGQPALLDYDPQGSSMHWLSNRGSALPAVHGISAFEKRMDVTRSFQLRVPESCNWVIVDSPAGYDAAQFRELTRDADKVLMPVLPSKFDIHAASRCIAELLLVAKLSRSHAQLGIIANRTRRNNRMFSTLIKFLESLGIPVVAVLRDSQNYVRAAEQGMGLCDLRPYQVKKDQSEWDRLIAFVSADQPRDIDAVRIAEGATSPTLSAGG
ncbi:MAG: AAA family ATPase [Pseudomonadota bacterium]